jgi:hypothetical protein
MSTDVIRRRTPPSSDHSLSARTRARTAQRKDGSVAVFSSANEVESVFGRFFEHVSTDPQLRPKFVGAATAFRVNHSGPDAWISMDTRCDPPVVKVGQAARDEDVEVQMFMSSDDGHKFWLGELNIPMAMARRKVKVEGSVGKLLKLLPAMQPAFGMYREFLTEQGMADKLDA